MAQIVALVDDLFFQMKMVETAKHVGVSLRACTTVDALLGEIRAEQPRLAVIDLNTRNDAATGGGPLEAIQRLRTVAPGVAMVAYLSHLQKDLAEQARSAGCQQVMPRSVFTRDLPRMFADAKLASETK